MEHHSVSGEDKKELHRKKMIAPIVITVFVVIYLIVYAAVCMFTPVPFALKVLLGIISLALIGVIIYVLMERIQEIRSGEEDDLSKY